jgi:Protein of unknown function (DUF3619)
MTTPTTTPLQAAHAVRLTRQTLDNGLEQLPHDITERLRAARVQALAQRTRPAQITAQNGGFFAWLQRMPNLTRGLIGIPVLAMALLIGKNIHAPTALSPDVALNSLFEPTPVSLMSTAHHDALNIDAILNEQIPLQAYLDDDFNRFVEQDVLKTKVQTPTQNQSVQKP